MTKVGVWIQLPPKARWRTEGIGRLIGYIIEGTATTKGVKYVLCAPPWMEEELQAFISELPPRVRDHVTFKCAPGSRFRWNVYQDSTRKGVRKPDWLRRWIANMLRRPSYGQLAVGALAIVFAAVGRVLNPMRWVRAAYEWIDPINRMRRVVSHSRLADLIAPATLVQAEYNANVIYANSLKGVDVWISPYPGFNSAVGFRAPFVLIFPDYVLADFPENFPESARRNIEEQFGQTVAAADRIISFTEDVRSRHVVGYFGAEREKTAVIPHCLMDISASWQGPQLEPRRFETRSHANGLIRTYARDMLSSRKDLPHARFWGLLADSTDFSELQFAFCPQQARPYKNLPRLVEMAVELNRVRGVPLHLVVSAFIDLANKSDPFVATVQRLDAWEYLTIAPALPADVHAALYHAAALAVHPSYFEGGLSFIFGEAVSMGTPCLLSKNAANLESLDPVAMDYMLFDPSSAMDMADKVEYALANRNEVLARQREHVAHIARTRGWDKVALEYLAVLEEAKRAALTRA
ncbi:MAG: glycosyltransferase [Hyphomonadaceae bacterium]|nr:glycosyltransferase [Hyphomonadaceae bacterium]